LIHKSGVPIVALLLLSTELNPSASSICAVACSNFYWRKSNYEQKRNR